MKGFERRATRLAAEQFDRIGHRHQAWLRSVQDAVVYGGGADVQHGRTLSPTRIRGLKDQLLRITDTAPDCLYRISTKDPNGPLWALGCIMPTSIKRVVNTREQGLPMVHFVSTTIAITPQSILVNVKLVNFGIAVHALEQAMQRGSSEIPSEGRAQAAAETLRDGLIGALMMLYPMLRYYAEHRKHLPAGCFAAPAGRDLLVGPIRAALVDPADDHALDLNTLYAFAPDHPPTQRLRPPFSDGDVMLQADAHTHIAGAELNDRKKRLLRMLTAFRDRNSDALLTAFDAVFFGINLGRVDDEKAIDTMMEDFLALTQTDEWQRYEEGQIERRGL